MPRRRPCQETQHQTARKADWRIAVYIRLSREDGGDESLSVTNQRKIILEYLEHSFGEAYSLTDFYIDDGVTGTTEHNRPEFQRMIGAIEHGDVNCVICKTLSRMFRNYADQGYYLENYFPKRSVRFISTANPKVDSYLDPDIICGLEVPINGLINDRYAGKTSHDVRQTFDSKRRAGEFIGAFAPFGYQKDPNNKNHLVIDETAAAVVLSIYHWFVLEGMSKNGIARRLNDCGIPSPAAYKRQTGLKYHNPNTGKSDGLWCAKTIGDILNNRMYLGDMVQGKQKVISYKIHERVSIPQSAWFIVPHTHEPIVSQALFERAAALQLRDTRTAPGQAKPHLFSGLVYCADCGKAMSRNTSKNIAYYVCRTFKDKKRCSRHTIREDVLQQAVLATIQKQIDLAGPLETTIRTIQNTPVACTRLQRLGQLAEHHTKELQKVTQVADTLYVDWKSGGISKERYLRLSGKLEEQAAHLNQMILGLQEERKAEESGGSPGSPYLADFLETRNIHHLERGLLGELVDRIEIHESGEITILFQFADPHLRLAEDFGNNPWIEEQKPCAGAKNGTAAQTPRA